MQKLVLSGIFLFLIVFPSYAFADGPYLNIPPTNAFDKIHSDNGTINAVNFSMPLNIIGGTGVTVTSNNSTHTVKITNTAAINTHTGTYNQTLANNAVKNSGGQGLNFINGTNNPINLVNDPTRNQINITISSTGGGGGGVTSLNALTGALTIACVSGNTTCTTSGGNTITVNTAWNIVTTGGSAQNFTKLVGFKNNLAMYSDMLLYLNKINTTNFNLYEKDNTYGAAGLITQSKNSLTPNAANQFAVAPSGTNTNSLVSIFRTSDVVTNIQEMRIGSDAHVSNEFAIDTQNAGNQAKIPLVIYINGSKYISYDTGNTITFTKTLVGSGVGINPQTSTGTAVFGGFDVSGGSTFTITSGSTATPFSGASNFQGLIVGRDDTQNTSCLLWIGNGGSIIISQTSSDCIASSTPGATQTGYYNVAGVFTMKNGFAASHTYKILALVRTGTSGG